MFRGFQVTFDARHAPSPRRVMLDPEGNEFCVT